LKILLISGHTKAPFTRYNLLSIRLYNPVVSCKRGLKDDGTTEPRGTDDETATVSN